MIDLFVSVLFFVNLVKREKRKKNAKHRGNVCFYNDLRIIELLQNLWDFTDLEYYSSDNEANYMNQLKINWFFKFFFYCLIKNASHYQPISNIDEEYLNSWFSVQLLQGILDSYHVNYNDRRLIFAQKCFHMATQFFIRCVCRYGLPVTETFKMIDRLKQSVMKGCEYRILLKKCCSLNF